MVLDSATAALVAGYGVIPAFCMLMGAVVASYVVIPPQKVVYALQHFAAGIILSAVAIDFVPILVGNNTSPWEIAAVIIGFIGGAGMLVLVEHFMEDDEGEEEKKDDKRKSLIPREERIEEQPVAERSQRAPTAAYTATGGGPDSHNLMAGQANQFNSAYGGQAYGKNILEMEERRAQARFGVNNDDPYALREGTKRKTYRPSMVTMAYNKAGVSKGQQKGNVAVARNTVLGNTLMKSKTFAIPEHEQQAELPIIPPNKYPYSLAVAVFLDSFLDGTFIGIAFAAAKQTGNQFGGLLLAMSLSIEMTFLGLTFAIAIPETVSSCAKIASIIAGPAILFGSTFFGAGVGLALESFTIPFMLITAFGASALLFTVGVELLAEAHENEEGFEWWIGMSMIAGFMLTVVIDKVLKFVTA